MPSIQNKASTGNTTKKEKYKREVKSNYINLDQSEAAKEFFAAVNSINIPKITEMLAGNPNLIRRPDAWGNNVMHIIAQQKSLELARIFIPIIQKQSMYWGEIFEFNFFELSPMQIMLLNKDWAFMQTLCEEFPVMRLQLLTCLDLYDSTLYPYAVHTQQNAFVAWLFEMERVSPDQICEDLNFINNTGLHLAIFQKNYPLITVFLTKGACLSLSVQNGPIGPMGVTPIQLAFLLNDWQTIQLIAQRYLQVLLAALDIKLIHQYTYAVMKGDLDTIKFCYLNGIEPDAPCDMQDNTALYWALKKRDQKLLYWVADSACLIKKNNQGIAPIDLVFPKNRQEIDWECLFHIVDSCSLPTTENDDNHEIYDLFDDILKEALENRQHEIVIAFRDSPMLDMYLTGSLRIDNYLSTLWNDPTFHSYLERLLDSSRERTAQFIEEFILGKIGKSWPEILQENEEFIDKIDYEFIPGNFVITPAGITYNRKTLLGWVEGKHSEPVTRQALSSQQLVDNRLARKLFFYCLLYHFDKKNPPDFLKCPISGKLFTDPIVAPDGWTYNKDALIDYLSKFEYHFFGLDQMEHGENAKHQVGKLPRNLLIKNFIEYNINPYLVENMECDPPNEKVLGISMFKIEQSKKELDEATIELAYPLEEGPQRGF